MLTSANGDTDEWNMDYTLQSIVDGVKLLKQTFKLRFAISGYTYDTNVWIDFNGQSSFEPNDFELVFDGCQLQITQQR